MRYNYLLLSELLRGTRLEKGYSIRSLARAVGISDTEIARIENGIRKNINLITLVKMCETLDIDFVELLKITGYFPYTYSRVIYNDDFPQPERTIKEAKTMCPDCDFYCPICKVCVIKEDCK